MLKNEPIHTPDDLWSNHRRNRNNLQSLAPSSAAWSDFVRLLPFETGCDFQRVLYGVAPEPFHVIYRSYMNPNDPHQTEEKITIGGRPRLLVLGDAMTRTGSTNSSLDIFPLRDGFRKDVSAASLSQQTHWIKIVYGNHHSRATVCAVTLDNEDSPLLTEAVKALPWPKQEEFYLAKQFMVVK